MIIFEDSYYKRFPGKWTEMSEETPADWSKRWYRSEKAYLNSYFKVRLTDGRETSSRWEGNGWSCERLKPGWKVVQWLQPPIVA